MYAHFRSFGDVPWRALEGIGEVGRWGRGLGEAVSDHPYRVVQSRWLEYLRKESGQNFQGSRIAGFRIFKVNRMKMKIFSLQGYENVNSK